MRLPYSAIGVTFEGYCFSLKGLFYTRATRCRQVYCEFKVQISPGTSLLKEKV